MRRVVITGLGVLAPNGNGIESFTQSLKEGRSGIRFFEKLKALNFSCQLGGAPQDIESLRQTLFTEEERRTMNEILTFAAIAGLECWRAAKLPDPRANKDQIYEDTGAVIGIGMCGIDTVANMIPMVDAGNARRMGSSIVENVMASGSSARLCSFLGIGGQVTTNSSACVTGTEAIAEGYFKVKEGRADRMLAGGVECASHYIWGAFDAMRVLSRNHNNAPEKGSRPLSATSTGFVPSGGAGLLMLEELETALSRGAPIYAEILGAEVNSGGQRNEGSMTAPSSRGVVRCIQKAIERANIKPHEIDLINGHLTGTIADTAEIQNWQKALGLSSAEFPLIQSTKSMIGHALGAAGGIECVASVLQLHHGFVHPSLNCEDLNPSLVDFRDKIPQQMISRKINIVAKAGFGFGDVNGCIIFKKWS